MRLRAIIACCMLIFMSTGVLPITVYAHSFTTTNQRSRSATSEDFPTVKPDYKMNKRQ